MQNTAYSLFQYLQVVDDPVPQTNNSSQPEGTEGSQSGSRFQGCIKILMHYNFF